MPDIPEKELMRKYPQIKKFCYVSSTAGTVSIIKLILIARLECGRSWV